MQILLVEDDMPLASTLARALSGSGYVVNHVDRGSHAILALENSAADIVILDLGLPDMNGLDLLRSVRSKDRDIPILLLTARDSIDDKVAGLDSGADDYLAKPFEMPELLARLRVLERRLSTSRTNLIAVGEVTLDILSLSVSVQGVDLELPRREFMLLKVLMGNAGRVMAKRSLESSLYAWGEEVSSNAVEVHIHHLRKKLGADFIHTVRGVGYRIQAP